MNYFYEMNIVYCLFKYYLSQSPEFANLKYFDPELKTVNNGKEDFNLKFDLAFEKFDDNQRDLLRPIVYALLLELNKINNSQIMDLIDERLIQSIEKEHKDIYGSIGELIGKFRDNLFNDILITVNPEAKLDIRLGGQNYTLDCYIADNKGEPVFVYYDEKGCNYKNTKDFKPKFLFYNRC